MNVYVLPYRYLSTLAETYSPLRLTEALRAIALHRKRSTAMPTTPTVSTRNEAIASVIEGLCFLIVNHATCAASEQWNPSRTSDESDDYIRDHSEWVNKLRKIREDFENLATGFIPRYEPSTYQVVKEQIAGAAKEVFEGYTKPTAVLEPLEPSSNPNEAMRRANIAAGYQPPAEQFGIHCQVDPDPSLDNPKV